MRMLTLAILLGTLMQVGCAAGFRAGSEKRGVGAAATIDPMYPPPPPPVSY